MKLETSTKDFQVIMEVASKLLNEVKLECDNDGLRFSGLDKSHICFFNVDFHRQYFEEYNCPTPESLIVDSQEFLEVLKRMKNDDRLIIESNEYHLRILFLGEATRTFNLRLIDSDYDTPSMPGLEYPNTDVDVPFSEWIDYLKDCSLYDNKVNVKMREDQLGLSISGDKGSYESWYDVGEDGLETVQSTFSLEYLQKFNALSRISNFLLISLGKDMPLTIKIKDLAETLKVTLLLAPRIESDY